MSYEIVIVGTGAFGTALSIAFLKCGHNVTLKPRTLQNQQLLLKDKTNQKYLAGIPLPPTLKIIADPLCLEKADLIVLAAPTQHTPEMLQTMAKHIPSNASLLVTSKGILETDSANIAFLADWLKQNFPLNETYVLSGPNFAKEIALDLPAAATLAGKNIIKTKALADKLRQQNFRLYPSTDIRGVSLSGAIKNVYAIAAGMCAGSALGQNALAATVTRALAEMKRLGQAMGADPETFSGLSGIGDLMLTCNSLTSRNMSLGHELARGSSLKNILAKRYTVSEGVATAKALYNLNQNYYKIRMPLADSVYQILFEEIEIPKILRNLLTKGEVRMESE